MVACGARASFELGVAGYSGRQDWNWDRFVDAWAGMADWQIPILLGSRLSGEFYRGRGIGGLGAGIGTSILSEAIRLCLTRRFADWTPWEDGRSSNFS